MKQSIKNIKGQEMENNFFNTNGNFGKVNIFDDFYQNSLNKVKQPSWTMETAFEDENLGTTLGGIGQGIGVISGIYAAVKDRKMRNKLYDMEKRRVERNEAKEDKFHSDMTKAWS